MGAGARARQSSPHERHHDVHVRQLAADLQHYDGLHAVQEPAAGPAADERRVRALRDRRHEEVAVDSEGGVCGYELVGVGAGDLEG